MNWTVHWWPRWRSSSCSSSSGCSCCCCRFLLSARLHEISDRWSDGPLAAEMTAGEVKHVIRALFENNDRRSATLAAIKWTVLLQQYKSACHHLRLAQAFQSSLSSWNCRFCLKFPDLSRKSSRIWQKYLYFIIIHPVIMTLIFFIITVHRHRVIWAIIDLHATSHGTATTV